MPPPYTLDVVGAVPTGRCDCGTSPLECDAAELACADSELNVGVVLPRTKRCVSSASSSLSSNASARSLLTVVSRSRDILDDAREWNDGGGEFGMGYVGLGKGVDAVSGPSAS